MILVIDTETTGLLRMGEPADAPGQPRMASFAGIVWNDAGEEEETLYALFQPDGWDMPPETSAINGLTNEKLREHGVPVGDVLPVIREMILRADWIVSYGIDFDLKVIRGELRRAGLDDCREHLQAHKWCAQRTATRLCKLPPSDKMMASGRKTAKTPKLWEAVEILLGIKRHQWPQHDALDDVRMLKRLCVKMREIRDAAK